jgi:chromosome segregation ATPase
MEKQELMKSREDKLGDFQERIKDLQKKKNILSYRTWEMRQEVEPKEDELEFLKEELFSLETEFENLLKDEKGLQDTEVLIIRDKEKLGKRVK